MVSDELSRLRGISRRQTATYKTLKEQQRLLKEQGYAHIGKRPTAKRDDLLAHARSEYEQAMQDLRDDVSIIRNRANERKVKSTPESRQKIEKMLSTGWTLQDACEQLVKEGDKASMAALHEYLPYAARAGHLPQVHNVDAKDYKRLIEHAQDVIGVYEPRLWDKQEAQARAELREAEISMGLMESNHTKLVGHLDNQAIHPLNPGVRNIYRWAGLPAKDSHYEQDAYQPGLEQLEQTVMNGRVV
jgi:hypothetical protein